MKVDPATGGKPNAGMRDKSCISQKWLQHWSFRVHIWTGMQIGCIMWGKIHIQPVLYIIDKSQPVTFCVKRGLWNLQYETVTLVLQQTAQVKVDSSVVVYPAQNSAWNPGCPAQMWSQRIKVVVTKIIHCIFPDEQLIPSLRFPWLLTQKSSLHLLPYLFH